MDRQIKAERAWQIPYLISKKIENFSFATLSELSLQEIRQLMSEPEPLHRFTEKMSSAFFSAIKKIATSYEGNARLIWQGCPPSAEVVYRFLEFDGVGPKIATMAVNILARDFKIPFSDYYSIDISVDVHIRRVFERLGLCVVGATVEQIIYRARALHPIFPGLLDLPCWEIGRQWCHSKNPNCSDCYMNDICLYRNVVTC
jgi:endonuclease-3